ncbi:hypothetical protein [Bifidobacterium phage PMBT6]|nr:hypothetical protein [Bifidobacterium phage PMBT6]QDF14865.1 hypothetical protein [Bifidobacterium phage PMBT6]
MLPSIIRSKLRWSRSDSGFLFGTAGFRGFLARGSTTPDSSCCFLRRYFALFLHDSEQYRCRRPWPEGLNSEPHISQITF